MLGCAPAEFHHETPPERKPHRRKRPTRPVANIAEGTVEAAVAYPPRLGKPRLPTYSTLLQEVHVLGKALWVVRRM